MSHSDKFKTAVFGGFRKKDVLARFEQVINQYEGELEQLRQAEKQLKEQLAEKDALHAKQLVKMRQYVVQLQKYRSRLKSMSAGQQTVLDQKNSQLDEAELLNRQLNGKIRVLEERLSRYDALDKTKERMIASAEKISRRKTDEMIQLAKNQVETEYAARMEQADRQAKQLLDQAGSSAKQIAEQTKQTLQQMIARSQQDADEIVGQAQAQAEQILAGAHASGPKQRLKQAYEALGQQSVDQVGALKLDIERQVGEAVENLDQAVESVQTAKSKLETLTDPDEALEKTTKDYKRILEQFLT